MVNSACSLVDVVIATKSSIICSVGFCVATAGQENVGGGRGMDTIVGLTVRFLVVINLVCFFFFKSDLVGVIKTLPLLNTMYWFALRSLITMFVICVSQTGLCDLVWSGQRGV